MANRKVLINRHTSTSGAPVAADMYLGEIAVAHKTGEEIIWTKNNAGEMVPFISCAQTKTMIDNAITAANVTYDVKEGEQEPHISVETADTTPGEVTFILTSNDIQSESAFNDYSARTNNALTALTDAFNSLLDITVTGITGDSIITATKVDENSGSNGYNLTHKQALATDGFNKLTTDAYGHVTAATPVATADIKALGFKTSADTDAEIAELSGATEAISGYAATQISQLSAGTLQLSADTHNKIESVYDSATTYADDAIATAIDALDSSKTAADNKHYITAITIEDGKLSTIGEAEIPVLASAVTGTGNVVTDIAVNDHTITFAKDLTVASDADLKAVSGIVNTFSAATVAEFTELSAYTKDVDDKVKALSAGTIQLSADTYAAINQLSGYAHGEIVELSGAVQANETDIDNLSGATVAGFNSAFTAIQAMDKAADVVAGQVVTTVAQEDGKVTETKANVKDLQLGGYSKDTTATGDIESTDTINAALSKLENKAAAITIANADKSINVTTGATGTDINVNIKSGEKVLAKDGDAGLYTDIDLVKITTGLPAEIKERYQLLATDNSQIGVNIDVPKDSHIVSINYITTGEHAQNLEYVYIDASGVTQTTYVDMSELVLEAEFASGVTVTDHIAHGVVDPASESFLTVGGAGFKLSGVQDAIDAKVNALDVTGDTAAAGQYVAAIEQTDGVVAVKTRANVSEAVLNNYAKESDATAVAATDTVNQAISKLENQVDAAKAAATTKVVEGTDAGNNMTITPTTSSTDGSVTYTVDLTDVASKTDLDAEIAARKAVDGQTGQTYAANTGATYITGATSLNDADLKLDTALKAVADQVEGLDYTGLTDENTKVVTDVKQENGLVSASATTVGDLVITAITTADTKVAANDNLATIAGKLQGQIDAMDSTGQTTGNGYFLTSVQIADGKITAATQDDKVNSASTADSAKVAANAAHASAATKVDSALTLTDVAGTNNVVFDGSANKTVTFGTATSISGRNSMSMTDTGVVDVEIIDCGEY